MHKDDEHRVRLENLSRGFPEGERRHAVLKGLNASFAPGSAVALRGRSGSGKSTLLNLIAGIDAPDEGRIVIDGRDVTAMSETDRTLFRRRHVGFVYQAFNLVPTLTVADNVRLVLELNGVEEKRAEARIDELLEAVGLAGRRASYPELLSGGEQQRVALAWAIAHRPLLLLADEPTGNLDERTAESVLALLDRLRREEGATLVMATHSESVASTCDEILELRDGRLQTGRHT